MKKRLVIAGVIGLFVMRTSANIVGTDVQNFNTTSNGIDFVTVQSSETLEPGFVNVGLFFNYAKNTLPYFEDPPGVHVNYDDSLTMADVNLGLGLTRNFDIGVNFPFMVYQENNGKGSSVEYEGGGNTEVRVNAKWRLWGDEKGGAALVGSTSVNRVEDSPYIGRGGGLVNNLEVATDTTLGRRLAVGLNVGYRFKNPGEKLAQFPIQPYRDQIIGSVAASYLIPGMPMKLITEIYGGQPARGLDEASTKIQTVAEALVGLKYDLTRQVAMHFGTGTRLTDGSASPDYRVYTGFNWATGPIFGEKPTKEDVAVAVSQGLPEPITPALATRVPIKGESTFVAPEVMFKFNSDVPDTESSKDLLEPLVAHLKLQPSYIHLVVKGHTDAVGPSEYNLQLSVRRANNVRKALIQTFGLDEKKITAVGYGETQPVADNGNFQGRQRNRRVEFTISR